VKPEEVVSPKESGLTPSENSLDEPETDDLEPIEDFHPKWDMAGGWNLLLRQPFKKKLTQNR